MAIFTEMQSLQIKTSILAFLLLWAGYSASAQSYMLFPNDTVIESGTMEDLHILRITQNNISNNTLTLKWKKVSAIVPDKWDAANCDNVFCNTILADSGTMNPVAYTSFAFLEMHITPKINYGTAVIRYMVWDAANPSESDTLTYILNLANSGIEELKLSRVWTSGDMLFFSNPGSFRKAEIYDFSGRLLISSELLTAQLSIASLSPGFYYVLLFDKQEKPYFYKICYERN